MVGKLVNSCLLSGMKMKPDNIPPDFSVTLAVNPAESEVQMWAECGIIIIIIIIIKPNALLTRCLCPSSPPLPLWRLFSTWKSHIPEELCGPAASNVSQIDVHTHARRTSFHPQAVTLPHACAPQRLGPAGNPSQLSQSRSSLTLWLSKHRGCFFNHVSLCLPSVDVDNLCGLLQEGKAPSSFLSRDCFCTFPSPQSRSQTLMRGSENLPAARRGSLYSVSLC